MREEIAFHKGELDRIHESGEYALSDLLTQPKPPKDYATRVEDLQEEVSNIIIARYILLKRI